MKKLSIALFAVAGIACTVSGATQIPGTPRFQNNDTAAGYQSPAVKAELKINVKDARKSFFSVSFIAAVRSNVFQVNHQHAITLG